MQVVVLWLSGGVLYFRASDGRSGSEPAVGFEAHERVLRLFPGWEVEYL